MNYPNVIKYMEWGDLPSLANVKGMEHWVPLESRHPFDGNDMVLAIEKMKNNMASFDMFCINKWKKEDGIHYFVWLFGNPERFFQLMEKWLEVKE